MIDTLYVLVVNVVFFGAICLFFIQKYYKVKYRSILYIGTFCFLAVLSSIFGILIEAAATTNNLPLATLFYRVQVTLAFSAYIFVNMWTGAVTKSDKKRSVWISLASFLVIMFIIWAFNPTAEEIGGTIEFTLTSMYKNPKGLPLVEIMVAFTNIIVAYPIYLFFRIAKDTKERIIRLKCFLMSMGLFISTAAYSIEFTGVISYRYMLISRPMIFVGIFTLFFGYAMPKWLEIKLVRHASVSERPVRSRSPLEEFFLRPTAPRTRSKLGVFSETIGLNHEQMAGRKILLEFNPASNYEEVIQDFTTEALANAEQIVIFTRRGSSIHSSLREYEGVKFFCLTQQFSIPKEFSGNEILLPSGDTSLILDVLNKAIKTNPESAINVIFDNLSDLLLSIGFDKTYRFIRYAVEMLASPKNTVLFLLNQTAHDPNVMSSLKGLFSDQMTYGEKGLQAIKLRNVLQAY